jgi:hypothetical protein
MIFQRCFISQFQIVEIKRSRSQLSGFFLGCKTLVLIQSHFYGLQGVNRLLQRLI